jgi:excisionase family DNA binding protein
MPLEPVELLTVDEAAARLRISRWKVYDLIRTNQLASIQIGRARRIPASAVNTLITRLMEEAS